MVVKRTIDNIGNDVSNDFAKSQSFQDVRYLDARSVTRRTQKDTNTPFVTSQTSSLLSSDIKNHAFAMLPPPQNYGDTSNRAFLHTLIPSIGGKESIENEIARIQEYINKLKGEMAKVKGASELNLIENQIIAAQNILQLLILLLDFIESFEHIEGLRKKNQKG